MFRALYTAASGMRSQQTQVDVIANNLANVNTAGFKRSDVNFEDMLYATPVRPGTMRADGSTESGMQVGNGSHITATVKNFNNGTFIDTGRPLDLAIQGDGFFELQGVDGGRVFTRDGSFRLDKDGSIVNSQGLKLVPGLGQVPVGSKLAISRDGTVTATVGDTVTQLGQISLVTFTNPAGLSAEGGNLYRQTEASGQPVTVNPGNQGAGEILSGSVERSNVDIATELINLILAQRAYETNSKAINTADQMLSQANQITR
jgi:flagellar basal-body rod protein FlgG